MDMNFNLSKGEHENAKDGTCAMEAVSILAGERFSDRPACVCPVIADFVRLTNDYLPDDETRNRLLLPLLPRLIGTRDSSKELARSYLAADYAVRVFAASALQAVGLTDTLSGLPKIVNEKTARAAFKAVRAVEADVAANVAYYAASAIFYAANAAVISADIACGDYGFDAVDAARAAANASCAAHTANIRAAANAAEMDVLYEKSVELIEKMIEV